MCRNLLPFALLAALLLSGVSAQVSEMSLDPLLSFITCVRESKPGYCLRERALGYFETWLTGEEDEDGNPAGSETDDEDEPGSKLSPYWRKMVDQAAERIASFYGEEEEGEGKQLPDGVNLQDNNNTALDGTHEGSAGRGHKKKKIKAIKKAIIKLVIIALLIKSKLKMLLTAFQTFLQFKAVLLATVYVLIHVVKLWVEIKHKHHPQKVIYYENAHHQHHYDHDDHHHEHDEHGSGWNLWGRSGVEATTTPFPIALAPYLGRTGKNLPYSAHVPKEELSSKTPPLTHVK